MKSYFRIYVDIAIEQGGILLTEDSAGVLIYFQPDALKAISKENENINTRLRTVCEEDYERAIALITGLEQLHPHDPPHYYIALLAVQRSSRGGHSVKYLFNEMNKILDKSNLPCYAECTRYSTRTLIKRWGYRDNGPPLRVEGFPDLFPVWREPQ